MKTKHFLLMLAVSTMLTINAQIVEQQLTHSLPAISQMVGTAVAIAGDYAFTTSDLFTHQMGGRVRIFKSANGSWSQTQALTRANNCGTQQNASNQFGASVDATGEWLSVGAPGWDSDCLGNIGPDGVLFLYRRVGDTYDLHQILSDPSFNVNERFGASVAITGEWMFVGAPGKTVASAYNAGAVFIYRLNNLSNNWDLFQTITSTATKDFGSSVDVDGTNALIGSKYNTENSNSNSGAAYFMRFDGTRWVQEQKMTYDGQVRSAYFGATVALSGSHAAVGTDYKKAVYTYKLIENEWVRQNTLTDTNDEFGNKVAMEGDYLLVANYQKYTGSKRTGVTQLYHYADGNWALQETITSSDGAEGDAFGKAIALQGGRLIMGAPAKSSGVGATYIYSGAIEMPVITADFESSSLIKAIYKDIIFTDRSTATGTQINSWSWDFDGDGFEDSNLRSPVHQFTIPGVFQVRLTVSDGTLSSTKTKLITTVSQSSDTCFSYIPFQGLESERMGVAGWNVLSQGADEQPAIGHLLPQPPASIQVAYYYLAGRNYGTVDTGSTAAMRALNGIEQWPHLLKTMDSNGYSPEDLEVSFGLMSLGNDVQDVDWNMFGPYESRTYKGGDFSIKVRGENCIRGTMPQLTLMIEYSTLTGGTDKMGGSTTAAIPLNDSEQSSQAVKDIAAAFLSDCGTAPIWLLFSSLQSANQFEFTSNMRNGGYFDVQQAFIIKSCNDGGTLTSATSPDDAAFRMEMEPGRLRISELVSPATIRLMDVTGKQVASCQTTETGVELELKEKGIYLLLVETENGRFTRKIAHE